MNLPISIALLSAIVATVGAQLLKPLIARLSKEEVYPHMLISTGGMPSSHTAGVTALTSSVGIISGPRSIEFAICFVFSIIVIHDSLNIRMEAGKHAKVINEWAEILSSMYKNGPFEPTNLKTFLGHSFSQVLGGLILGLLVGILLTLALKDIVII